MAKIDLSEEKLKLQEQKVRRIAKYYYARKDIQQNIANQAVNKELIPRYFEGFGKRPDSIEYPSDILNFINKGATSFHVSEETWKDPLQITSQNMEKLRIGWDLLLDIDCKYVEYSKIAAFLLTEALYFRGIQNLGLKFSGGSGWHVGLGFEAFPEKIHDIKIKDFFPQGPRIIAAYLKNMIKEPLKNYILELSNPRDIALSLGKEEEKLYETIKGKKEFNPFSILEIDTILISPRHLFRAAYSLHEKTALTSIVIRPDQLKSFKLGWAKPERVFPKVFMPKPEKNEAKELITEAIDWMASQEQSKQEEIKNQQKIDTLNIVQKEIRKKPRIGNIELKDIQTYMFPPCIKKILEGIKQDGRKRSLFVLINFFRNLNLDFNEIDKRIMEWNKKNQVPLKEGYIKTQISWFQKQEKRLPPNCSLNPYYLDIGVCIPDALCKKIKNPINYVYAKARSAQNPYKPKGKKENKKEFY